MDKNAREKSMRDQKGWKNTKSRKAVVEVLENAEAPISAEDIYLRIRQTGQPTNLSTVYRTLALLESRGIVQKTLINDSCARFELAGEVHRHRIICTNCNRTVPISECPLMFLERDIIEKTMFEITGHRLELYGLCPKCKSDLNH